MSHNIKPRSRVSQSRVWVYFKQSDGDPDKARCNLCSVEICHRGSTNVLWNHVKIKHSIDKNSLSQNKPDQFDSMILKANNNKQTRRNQYTNTTTSGSSNSNQSRQLLHHHHHHNHNNNNYNNNTDTISDYNDLSLASMKPLPSTSLSKNLIARLNQLSAPVTRKLKFWNKKSFQVNQYDPSFKVIYLGNLGVQLWSKDESCLEKPLSTLWNNYLVNMKTEIVMRLTICNSGLKAITRQHGLTQYWSNRLVYCCSHKNYPRIFSWVYRHEGKKMRQELRCHAVFCPSPEKASKMVTLLNERIACALQEFRREKKSRSSSSSTIVNNSGTNKNEYQLHQNLQRTVPLRRQILAKGSANFRPPLERSKSAPKLTSILEEEDYESTDEVEEEEEVCDEMVDQQLHDVFEYEESFGDKDDDDDDDNSEEMSKNEDEDDLNKIESNSLTTTVNEETSNSSAYATGDRSFVEKQRKSHSELNGSVDQPNPPNSSATGTITSEAHINHIITNEALDSASISSAHLSQTKELNPLSESIDDSCNNHNHNQTHFTISHRNQNTSANTNISSSSDKRLLINQVNPPLLTHDINEANSNKLSLVNRNHQAKNESSGSNMNELLEKQQQQQQDRADDEPTKEIILSWPNFVIR